VSEQQVDRPLHVRVAMALGCRPEQATPGPRSWRCTCPQSPKALNFLPHGLADTSYLANYDTSWSATGPLIERLGIAFAWTDGSCHVGCPAGWVAIQRSRPADSFDPLTEGLGETHLIAACELVIALSAAGKLQLAPPLSSHPPEPPPSA
jgi:hypothetical protein